MKAFMLALGCAVVAIAGCGGDTKPSATAGVATPESTIAGASRTPDTRRSGIARVDAAIDAVLTGDLDALLGLIEYTPTPCEVNPEGLGAPPACRGDEPTGTPVDVVGFARCEGFYLRRADLIDYSRRDPFFGLPRASLYAVYRETVRFQPPSQYVVIFASGVPSPVGGGGFALDMTDGGITFISAGCEPSPAPGFARGRSLNDALIPPLGDPRRTLIPKVDEAIDAIVSGDVGAVRQLVRYSPTACVADRQGAGAGPVCGSSERNETLVEVLPSAGCEDAFMRPGDLNLDGIPFAGVTLYGVYLASAGSFPPGRFFVVFSVRATEAAVPSRGFALTMTADGITGVQYGCGQTPASMVNLQRPGATLVPPD